MREINTVVIHCTATKEGVDIGAKEIDGWHKDKGWSGIGYHYVFLLDGSVEVGRPEENQGAHVKGDNEDTIGAVYVGGLSRDLKPKDTRTDAQKKSLRCFVENMRNSFPGVSIKGHRDYSPDKNGNGIIEPSEWFKDCPCFDVEKEYS